MSSIWLIDGFNLIRQSRDLVTLETLSFDKAREVLISRLKQFSERSGEKVICVFDATGSVNPYRSEEPHGAVKAIYTKGGETADEFIIEMTQQKKEAVIVVTSDREILTAARKAGSSTMSSVEFDRLLSRLQRGPDLNLEEEESDNPRRGTQKKGPSHRRPKKERKISAKIRRWF
jgi:predicted RNA-binding protein with PIN domain